MTPDPRHATTTQTVAMTKESRSMSIVTGGGDDRPPTNNPLRFGRGLAAVMGFLECAALPDDRFNHGPGWRAAAASYLHLLERLIVCDDGATGQQIAGMVAEAVEVYLTEGSGHLERSP